MKSFWFFACLIVLGTIRGFSQGNSKQLFFDNYPVDNSYQTRFSILDIDRFVKPVFFFDFNQNSQEDNAEVLVLEAVVDSTPRSYISFYSGSNKQQLVDAALKRFVSKNIYASIDFNSIKSNGFYSNQAAKMNNASFEILKLDTTKRFNWEVEGGIFRGIRDNNGGIDRSRYGGVYNNDFSIPVLINSNSETESNRLKVAMDYKIGKNKKSGFALNCGYNEYLYRYFDTSPDSGFYLDQYDDSIYSTISERWRIKAFTTNASYYKGFKVGSYNSVFRLVLNNTFYSLWQTDIMNYTNSALQAEISLKDTATSLSIIGNHFFNGFNSGNFQYKLTGVRLTKKAKFELSAAYSSVRPNVGLSLFESSFYSSNVGLKNVTQFSMQLGAGLIKHKAKLFVDLKQVKGFTLWTNDLIVSQDESWNFFPSGHLMVEDVKIVRNLKFSSHVTVQHIESKLIALPSFVSQSSLYFKRSIASNKAFFKVGVRHNYFTSSIGMGYNPLVNSYYLNSASTVGNYNLFDVFGSLKIGPVEVNLNINHINKGFSGLNYFILDNYLMQGRNIQLGLVWNFVD